MSPGAVAATPSCRESRQGRCAAHRWRGCTSSSGFRRRGSGRTCRQCSGPTSAGAGRRCRASGDSRCRPGRRRHWRCRAGVRARSWRTRPQPPGGSGHTSPTPGFAALPLSECHGSRDSPRRPGRSGPRARRRPGARCRASWCNSRNDSGGNSRRRPASDRAPSGSCATHAACRSCPCGSRSRPAWHGRTRRAPSLRHAPTPACRRSSSSRAKGPSGRRDRRLHRAGMALKGPAGL